MTISYRVAILFLLLAAIVGVPFLLRPRQQAVATGSESLVIITPHNEAVRIEFDRAFRQWYQRTYHQNVSIDWRSMGGASDIVRFLDSSYEAADGDQRPGIGIDLFFGGGQYDHARQAKKGHTIPCGVKQRHPEWLNESVMPRRFSGEDYYDPEDRWYGCCLASFGICYNRDVLRYLGIPAPPSRWSDLADPRYFKQLALADPSKSGSINKAFEMLIQDQMSATLDRRPSPKSPALTNDLAEGWLQAFALIRMIGANARYFTDSAGKVPSDVGQGDAAVGMCIDFYGRFENETITRNEGSGRLQYLTPVHGSSVSVDPISLLRGAAHRQLAERFIDFCLSVEGQQLWNYRVGEPGGPSQFALRRLPVRRDLYTPEHRRRMSDPEALPYEQLGGFVYHPEWTAPLFSTIRRLIRASCLDTHDELRSAWQAILRVGGPAACPKAMAALTALPPDATYPAVMAEAAQTKKNALADIRAMRNWGQFFRAQYQEAERLSRSEHRMQKMGKKI